MREETPSLPAEDTVIAHALFGPLYRGRHPSRVASLSTVALGGAQVYYIPSMNAQYLANALVLFLTILFAFLSLNANLESLFVFDPEQLHEISKNAISRHGNDTQAVVASIVGTLQADPKVSWALATHEEWVLNNAGGAMGAMYIIHASITEYLIIFGSALGTEGHTGRHTADDYFHILRGTQQAFSPGSYEAEVYPQGSVHVLRRGEAKQYSMDGPCFALEYARGWIPPMLFFGYADALFSTLDFPSLWTTTRITGVQMLGNLLRGKI